VNVSLWFNYYSFDVMGDLTYGKSFDMLESGKSHWAIDILNEGIGYMGVIGYATWLVILFSQMPIITRNQRRFLKFCADQMDERIATKRDLPDISTYILESPPMSDTEFSEKAWNDGDSRLIIVAGSDTTAATLTFLFYHLALDQTCVQMLRKEITELGGNMSFTELQKLPYLNAVINETLRLHPPVPSGSQRLTPSEGIHVGSTYIPGGVNVVIPFYSMFRGEVRILLMRSKGLTLPKDKNCFARADEFIPDRW
jgi:hypothetical protein